MKGLFCAVIIILAVIIVINEVHNLRENIRAIKARQAAEQEKGENRIE